MYLKSDQTIWEPVGIIWIIQFPVPPVPYKLDHPNTADTTYSLIRIKIRTCVSYCSTLLSKAYIIYDLHLGLAFKSNNKHRKQQLFEENVRLIKSENLPFVTYINFKFVKTF